MIPPPGRFIANVRPLVRPLLMVLGLVAAGLLLRLLPPSGAAGWLERLARQPGAVGTLGLMVVGAALCAVGVPRQVVCYGCGVALGAGFGVIAALVAEVLACAADFWWARLLGRDWVLPRLSGRLARLDRALARRPFVATMSLRLLPVGSNLLLNLAAGVSSVAAVPFLAGSAVGYMPQTIVFVLAGSGTRLGHGMHLAVAATLFAASATLGLWLLRRDPIAGAPVAAPSQRPVSEGSGRAAIPPG